MSTTTEQEMLDCFIKLNESEKEAVLQLLKTFIRSKEQSEILNIEQFNSDTTSEEIKVEVVRQAPKNGTEQKQDTYW